MASLGLEYDFNLAATAPHKWQLASAHIVVPNKRSSWLQFTAQPLPIILKSSISCNKRSHCSSHQAAQSQEQTAADLGLHLSPSKETSDLLNPVDSFRSHQSTTQHAPQTTHPKGKLGWHHSPAKVTPTAWTRPPHNSLFAIVTASPHSHSA